MFVVIPLILSLNDYAAVPYGINSIPLSSDKAHVVLANYAVKHQKIEGELPTMNKVIQLAKNAATQLSSPPRIYATSGNSINLWPNQPGLVETTYGTRGAQLPGEDILSGTAPMTLRTVVESGINPGSYDVMFQATWNKSNATKNHTWRFHISANHQVTFTGEEGDNLPPLPM